MAAKASPKRSTNATPQKGKRNGGAIAHTDWRVKFIDALREKPIISVACKAANVSRSTAYRQREAAPEFAVEWDRALKVGLSALEDEAFSRAFSGSDTLVIFLLKCHAPDKYRDRQEHNINVDLTKLSPEELRLVAQGIVPPSIARVN